MRKYFGTDGIRGTVNQDKMTADIVLRLGMAAGHLFRRGEHKHRVVIGKDTRLSGYMLEPALVAGLTAMGMDVFLFGPMPTPGVAFITRAMRADLGIMISASHNKFEDNGIKLFGPDGHKLSDKLEAEIETLMDSGFGNALAPANALGRAKRIDDAQARYIEFAKRSFERALTLDGIKVVIDCANGAAYKVAPTALWELGAEVISIGVEPNGYNINQGCGSTDTALLAKTVRDHKADIGIALDGDADRLIICDETGETVNGDQILGLIASDWQQHEKLTAPGIVATIMSNLGLERYLQNIGLALARTQVGDRYVVAHMRKHGYNVGGEQSGHIVLSDFATTGDGLIAALQVLAVLKQKEMPISALCRVFEPVPQILENVRCGNTALLQDARICKLIKQGEAELNGAGRLVVRPSGTESLIRIMGEGDDPVLVQNIVQRIAHGIEAHGG